MRPGGREMETVTAHDRGTLEFVPNLPAQHHRLLTADNMVIRYGAANRIDSFRCTNVRTATDPTARSAKRNQRAIRHQQPRNGGALRSQDQPAGLHGADRRFQLTRKATARRAPPRPRSIPTRT